jgi:nucleoside 2-deoxyribosyltransferase
MNIYLAGPLFTLAERRFNEELAAEMRRLLPGVSIFFPQDCDHDLQGKPDFVSRLYRMLIEAIDRCDAVVAVLDGPDADSGTCVEIGYAHAKGKPIIGIRTDFRDGDHGLNLMNVGACSALVKLPSTSGSIEEVAEKVVAALLEVQLPNGTGFKSMGESVAR